MELFAQTFDLASLPAACESSAARGSQCQEEINERAAATAVRGGVDAMVILSNTTAPLSFKRHLLGASVILDATRGLFICDESIMLWTVTG